MPDAGGHLMGEPEDLRRMLEAFDERNAVAAQHEETMGRLVESVTTLSLAVQVLRVEVSRRPTRRQVDHRRRLSLAIIVGLIVLTAGLGTLHTDKCGPGARAERAVAALSAGVRDPDLLARAGEPTDTALCDLLVPTARHGAQPYPNRWTWLGAAGYLLAGLVLAVWAAGPRRADPPPDPVILGGRRSTDRS